MTIVFQQRSIVVVQALREIRVHKDQQVPPYCLQPQAWQRSSPHLPHIDDVRYPATAMPESPQTAMAGTCPLSRRELVSGNRARKSPAAEALAATMLGHPEHGQVIAADGP
jgi:hypothetical protein